MKKVISMKLLLLIQVILLCSNLYSATNSSVLLDMKIRNDTNTIWSLWDNCDTRQWTNETWGGGISTFQWGNFQGRNCLKVVVNSNWGFIRTDTAFPLENWNSPITGLKMDIYCQTNIPSNNNVKIEVCSSNFTTMYNGYTSTNMTTKQWKEIGWSFSGDLSKTAKINFVFDWLGTSYKPYTFYVDNIRIVSNGKAVSWDIMNQPQHKWTYNGWDDAVVWNSAVGVSGLIPITHNNTSTSNPAGALFMRWDASKPIVDYAKIYISGLNEDWSLYRGGKISAMISCSATNHIVVGFYDGTTERQTSEKRITSINTWETITWDIPNEDMTWSNLTELYFLVRTSSGDPTGTIYIDHIKRGW